MTLGDPGHRTTVSEAWMAGREHLAARGIDEAAITAEILLRHAMGVSRAGLYLVWQHPLDAGAWVRYRALLEERAAGRPVAYITGHREFMGLDFIVDERVLIPRPETEVVVETVLDVVRGTPAPLVADIGTGSGAIAVSVAAFRDDAAVIATDVSSGALEVARANARRSGVADRVTFLHGDLVEPVAASGYRPHVVACNPPYVSPAEAPGLPQEIRQFEPVLALVAPGSGASIHARLVRESPRLLREGGWLIMEVAAGQAAQVVELLNRSGMFGPVQTRRDALGWERVVAARVRETTATEGQGELLRAHV